MSAKKTVKVTAVVVTSLFALGGAFIGGARFSNAHRDALERASGAGNASRMVAILRQVDSGGETCHSALERELDNALIRTGYGTGQPDLTHLSRAYLKEAATYRKEHPYRSTHSYTDYVKYVLDLAEQKP